MRKSLYLCLMLVFLTSCRPDISDEAVIVMKSFADKQQLEIVGYGLSMPDSTIHSFFLLLHSHQRVDVTEARVLYIHTLKELLQTINCSTQLRPALHHYPFTENDIELGLGFRHEQYLFYPPPHIAYVCRAHGRIFYSTYDPLKCRLSDDDYYETYEEAESKLNEQLFATGKILK